MVKLSAFQPPPEIIAAAHQENEEIESVIEDQVKNKYLHHPHKIGPNEVQDSGYATQYKKDFCVQKISLGRKVFVNRGFFTFCIVLFLPVSLFKFTTRE